MGQVAPLAFVFKALAGHTRRLLCRPLQQTCSAEVHPCGMLDAVDVHAM